MAKKKKTRALKRPKVKRNAPKGWIKTSAVKVVRRNGEMTLLIRKPRRRSKR